MDLDKIIKSVKPNISDSSLKTYKGNLNILNKLINDNKFKEIKSLDFLLNPKKVIEILSNKSAHTKKNYLVSIIVVLQSQKEKFESVINEYNKYIGELQSKILDNYDNNEKSDKQEKNWLSLKEVQKLTTKYKKLANPLLDRVGEKYSNKELQIIQDYLLLLLYSGKFFPPLRNDFVMEIINSEEPMEKNKNYLVIGKDFMKFVFREFKTRKSSEDREILIKNKEFINLILTWIDITDKDYLLINIKDKNPMNENGITKNLNRIFQKEFGKNVSSSLLRSIYITEKYKNNNLSMKEKKKLAEDMTHSVKMASEVYNKID